jgi:hypothetical protein
MSKDDIGARIDAIRRSFAERQAPSGTPWSIEAADRPNQNRLEPHSAKQTRSHGTAVRAPSSFLNRELISERHLSSSGPTSQGDLRQSPVSESMSQQKMGGGPSAVRVALSFPQVVASPASIGSRGARRKGRALRHPGSTAHKMDAERSEETKMAQRADVYPRASSSSPSQESNVSSEDMSFNTGLSSSSEVPGEGEVPQQEADKP